MYWRILPPSSLGVQASGKWVNAKVGTGAKEGVNELESRHFPLLRGGVAAPIKQMRRYLKVGAAGEVKRLLQEDV